MRTTSYTGLVLGLAGGALDFLSGHVVSQSMNMGQEQMAAAVGLYLLGGIVAVTGLLIVQPSMAPKMRALGALMEVLGVVMAVVSSTISAMGPALSLGMLGVGGLMMLNGALMQRKMPAQATRAARRTLP